jgi:hypothetical protein
MSNTDSCELTHEKSTLANTLLYERILPVSQMKHGKPMEGSEEMVSQQIRWELLAVVVLRYRAAFGTYYQRLVARGMKKGHGGSRIPVVDQAIGNVSGAL